MPPVPAASRPSASHCARRPGGCLPMTACRCCLAALPPHNQRLGKIPHRKRLMSMFQDEVSRHMGTARAFKAKCRDGKDTGEYCDEPRLVERS